MDSKTLVSGNPGAGLQENIPESEWKPINERPKTIGRKNYMRNKPCQCGSGKKFKKCCWGKAARTRVKI